jgi:hypothetical protein
MHVFVSHFGKPLPSVRLMRSGDTENGVWCRVEYWGGLGLDFRCARNQSKAPPGAGFCFTCSGHVAWQNAIIFDIGVQIAAEVFDATAELQEGWPHPAVSPLRPFCFGSNQVQLFVTVVIDTFIVKNFHRISVASSFRFAFRFGCVWLC